MTAVIITVDITSTMSTNASPSLKIQIGLCACAVSFLLIVLTFFEIIAYSHLTLVSRRVDAAIKTGATLPQEISSDALGVYRSAAYWLPADAELYQIAGRLELRNATAFTKGDPQRMAVFELARDQFIAAISAAPARSFSWTLLAHVSNEMDASGAALNRLLRMSYFLGPHEASNILLRSYIEAKRWDELDEDIQDFAQRDFLAIWQNEQLHPKLFQVYIEASFAGRVGIRQAILPNRAASDLFDQQLLKFTGLLD